MGKHSRVRFAVQVVSDSKTTELHNQTVDAPGAWHDASYDLRPWAGREVALRLTVDGEAGSVGLWSNPDRLRPAGAAAARDDPARRCAARRSSLRVRLRREDFALQGRAAAVARRGLPARALAGQCDANLAAVDDDIAPAERHRRLGLRRHAASRVPHAGRSAASAGLRDRIVRPEQQCRPGLGTAAGFDSTIDETVRGPPETLLEGEPLWNWLRSHKDRNTFTYLHIVDPHGPYEPPAPYDEDYRKLQEQRSAVERDAASRRGVREIADRREPRSRCTTARFATTTRSCASSSIA